MSTRKQKHHVMSFTVEGRGPFPFDMLRYDRAWPADQMSVTKLATLAQEFGYRRVELVRAYPVGGDPNPAFERWASYGWRVITISGEPFGLTPPRSRP